jgi:hypothetical protein
MLKLNRGKKNTEKNEGNTKKGNKKGAKKGGKKATLMFETNKKRKSGAQRRNCEGGKDTQTLLPNFGLPKGSQ